MAQFDNPCLVIALPGFWRAAPGEGEKDMEEKYKLIHPHDWEIKDMDSGKIVYSVESREIAEEIAAKLNHGDLTLKKLYYDMCFGKRT